MSYLSEKRFFTKYMSNYIYNVINVRRDNMADFSYHEEKKQEAIEETRRICSQLPNYVSYYIRSIQFNTTAKTRLEYAKDIRNFFEYIVDTAILPEVKSVMDITLENLEKLDKIFFEEYLDYLQKYEKDGKVYKNETVSIKRKLSALRSFWAYLFINEMISSNIIDRVSIPKLREKEIIRMDKKETTDFLNAVEYGNTMTAKQTQYHEKQKVRDMAIVTLILSSGIRVSECVGLNIDDVDFRNSSLRIMRKGGKEAIVYFSDEASGYLMEYVEERKHIVTDESSEKALFLSSRKQRISIRSVEVLVKKYAQRAVPSKHITPHKLRSTFATTLYEQTGDIYLVGEVLGHNDISTTKKHYAHLSDKHKSENRNKVSLR